mmetsp:Transcript_24983/g.61395  ORF Transcript_24983/g.61395 Transcript_24983/m.61395 type:complete len:243 (-) Transcript_24983:76-804(-)
MFGLETVLASITHSGGHLPCGGDIVDTNQTALWEWKGETAGVYDNAWKDLDVTPHVWTHSDPVDPSVVDTWIPYGTVEAGVPDAADSHSALLAAVQMKASYDGTCNPLPGWGPNLNPVSGGGCTLNPMYNQPGLGDGASFGSGYHHARALAVPVCALGTKAQGKASLTTADKPLRPTCGHYLLATEACVMGAMEATMKIVQGEKGAIEGWGDNFAKSSTAAASAVTPMGAWMLKKHVFKITA